MNTRRNTRWRNAGATRWPAHDYSSPGAYFVTICSHGRAPVFSIAAVREVIEWAWSEIPAHFAFADVDAFVVMPNHVHGIVVLSDAMAPSVGSQHAGTLPKNAPLSVVVRSFKAAATRELRVRGLIGEGSFWQSNYHDRVVRSEAELNRVRQYIAYNPIAWQYDYENPDRSTDAVYEQTWAWIERRGSPD